jgi:hypothetical protein
MPRGGRRPGSGTKLGEKRGPYQSTVDKATAREITRKLITAKLEPLVHAQIANAQGLQYLVRRDKKTGEFVKVTMQDFDTIDQKETPLEVWQEKPNIQAFTDLMNRALDKPKEQEQELAVKHDGKLEIVIKKPW